LGEVARRLEPAFSLEAEFELRELELDFEFELELDEVVLGLSAATLGLELDLELDEVELELGFELELELIALLLGRGFVLSAGSGVSLSAAVRNRRGNVFFPSFMNDQVATVPFLQESLGRMSSSSTVGLGRTG
jgi:hypothetical protein